VLLVVMCAMTAVAACAPMKPATSWSADHWMGESLARLIG
jgi:hypothetical protein